MVSIRDVAKHANVAISTVSKVLNGYPGISEATRIKVNRAIEELGYMPNLVASALSSKQAGRVALLVCLNAGGHTVDEIELQYIAGAIRQAGELRLDVITVFLSMLKNKSLNEIISYFKSQNISGIIVYGMTKNDNVINELIEAGEFKTVLVDVPIVNINTSSLLINEQQAQYDVLKKTITESRGPADKVLYIAGSPDSFACGERLKGIMRLKEELGFDLYIEEGNFSEKQARDITFKYADKIDIIACASDLMAIGAMRVLIEKDVFHPVCGFDGITLMAYAGKQMNTISRNFAGMSAEAVCELERLLRGEKGRKVILPHTIVRMKYLDSIR